LGANVTSANDSPAASNSSSAMATTRTREVSIKILLYFNFPDNERAIMRS
jgi:hypothetical protein